MGYAHQVAASRYRCGTDRCLSFHDFPAQALVTTWSITAYDSHATAMRADPYSKLTHDPLLGYDPALGGVAPYPMAPDPRGAEDYFVSDAWTDSAAAATAMATGAKTSNGALAQDPDGRPLQTSIERLRRVYGMAVGLVTTAPFSDATPAGFLAHSTDRGLHDEIAHQLMAARPEVVIGAGFGTGEDWFPSRRWRPSKPYLTTCTSSALIRTAAKRY
jgi:alkaline phosphatase